MIARLIDLEFTYEGKQRVILETEEDFRESFEKYRGKSLRVDIKRNSKGRSLSSNAYFHVLVGKIADELQRQGMPETNTDVKKYLVREYGTLALYENGEVIIARIPKDATIDDFYPYTRCYEQDDEFACYVFYKRTRDMTNAEMCRLIEGAILEAKELGIETDTPQEIARLEAEWLMIERNKNE